ncbi:MAG: sigma-70 family RNA polymerase sigma factor [Ideonella sp.]|nr:sigma-70 family RNA polymerase sigma factor [Ideonella sp.]MBL0150352.1 sigma-70 family RNA polymerase sigma factor [Ideonella sp.]
MSVDAARATTPIHRLFKMAVWAGAETAVRLHIARGDDPNARDETGLTPLMIAAARNKSAVCRLLADAGADLTALDPSGRSALEIAVASGAPEAAAAIELALSQQTRQVVAFVQPPSEAPHESSIATPEEALVGGPSEGEKMVPDISPNGLEDAAPSPVSAPSPQVPTESAASSSVVNVPPAKLDFEDDGEPLDLSGWEAEEESAPPIDDRPAAIAHVATQEAIGRHVALDDSADWADFEADLPFHAAPMLRAQDAEGRIEIRALLLRASREGSVPEQAIEDVCRDANGARNQATETLLGVVINDMGAESDERFECRTPFDSTEAFVDPEESPEVAETVDDALAFLDNLRSRHNEPIRLYMREAQRTVLLSAEEEAGLGREMDRAADAAIDALSRWPAGIEWLRLSIGSARRGERSINSIVSSPREATAPIDAAGLDDLVAVETEPPIGAPDPAADRDDEEGELGPTTANEEALDAFALAEELATLIGSGTAGSESQIRAALASSSLRRSFLIGLCDAAADGSAEGATYARAIRSLMAPRGRMVRANLRLVISLAKRYMYSGVPMDDLIQDGNIGLVSAVDKFDWRRGFRFSTMATWWIRQQILRSIADSSLAIRLPVHVYEIAQRFPREAEAFEKKTGRPPTIQQLAKLVGHEWRKVETLLRASSAPLPIDSLDDEPTVEASKDPDPFEVISATELRRTLDELLAELGTRPEKIVRLRYGLGIDEPQTLEEIGALFDITRERIRQIESKALTKLKHPTRLARLAQWSLAPERHRPLEPADQSDDGDGEAFAAAPVAPLARAAATRPPIVVRTEGGKRLTAVERVLRQAALLDIPVEQTTRGEETTIWVSLTKAIDNRHRKLIRSLMALGFEHLPGKGYWQ